MNVYLILVIEQGSSGCQVVDRMSGNQCADSLRENTGCVGFLTVKDCGLLENEAGMNIFFKWKLF